jgi:glycosyltransferase involved in cell wall biosynthesis
LVDIPSMVYNLEVDEDHTYCLEQGIVHNCLPIVEAMACQKPFVATDYSTTQEFAGYENRGGEMKGSRGFGAKIGLMFQDKGVMRPYVNIEDFCDKVKLLIKDPDLCLEMGKAGRKFAIKECSCEVVGNKFTKLFDEVTKIPTVDCK